jgi:hypothetical protein
MRGSKAKNQHLLFEILSSATDTEKNVTKFLIRSSLASEYLPGGRRGIPNDYSWIIKPLLTQKKSPALCRASLLLFCIT